MDVWKPMPAAGVETDVISYNSLIFACGNAGEAEEALKVFKSMQTAGVKADIISYKTLIMVWHVCVHVHARTCVPARAHVHRRVYMSSLTHAHAHAQVHATVASHCGFN